MAKYRKKPVVIEAMQFQWAGSFDEYQAFCPFLKRVSTDAAIIPTLEGDMYVSIGDWIIKGVAGEFYPCKPVIFEATYEEAK